MLHATKLFYALYALCAMGAARLEGSPIPINAKPELFQEDECQDRLWAETDPERAGRFSDVPSTVMAGLTKRRSNHGKRTQILHS